MVLFWTFVEVSGVSQIWMQWVDESRRRQRRCSLNNTLSFFTVPKTMSLDHVAGSLFGANVKGGYIFISLLNLHVGVQRV